MAVGRRARDVGSLTTALNGGGLPYVEPLMMSADLPPSLYSHSSAPEINSVSGVAGGAGHAGVAAAPAMPPLPGDGSSRSRHFIDGVGLSPLSLAAQHHLRSQGLPGFGGTTRDSQQLLSASGIGSSLYRSGPGRGALPLLRPLQPAVPGINQLVQQQHELRQRAAVGQQQAFAARLVPGLDPSAAHRGGSYFYNPVAAYGNHTSAAVAATGALASSQRYPQQMSALPHYAPGNNLTAAAHQQQLTYSDKMNFAHTGPSQTQYSALQWGDRGQRFWC